jgi:flagellar biosynthetic protein FlhB
VVLSMVAITGFVLPLIVPNTVEALSSLIEQAGAFDVGNGAAGLRRIGEVSSDFFTQLGFAIAPLFAVLLFGAIVGAILQGETVIAFERLKPKLSKVSPKEGFKRLFSANSLVEFIKNLIKVLAIGGIAIWFTDQAVRSIISTVGFVPEYLPNYIMTAARKLLIAAAVLLVPVAIADILWRRYDWRRKLRMSQKDLKDEIKESEGSPEIRGKRARRRRELSQQRTIAVVPLADVILTNPTHVAVALKYDPETNDAPVCIAKGADHLARKIREIGFENDIPILENKPLARLLYEEVEIDQVVPVAQWAVLAEIIRFVFDLKENRAGAAPEGSVLQTSLDG